MTARGCEGQGPWTSLSLAHRPWWPETGGEGRTPQSSFTSFSLKKTPENLTKGPRRWGLCPAQRVNIQSKRQNVENSQEAQLLTADPRKGVEGFSREGAAPPPQSCASETPPATSAGPCQSSTRTCWDTQWLGWVCSSGRPLERKPGRERRASLGPSPSPSALQPLAESASFLQLLRQRAAPRAPRGECWVVGMGRGGVDGSRALSGEMASPQIFKKLEGRHFSTPRQTRMAPATLL